MKPGLSLLAACLALAYVGAASAAAMHAIARLEPTKGNTATGSVLFNQQDGKVKVRVHLTGLTPGSTHGIHVHENGDCSSGDGKSAGGHFNPTGASHGPPDGPHHAGDMPNVTADQSGEVSANFEITGFTVGSGNTDIIAKSVILHADPDDYKTQPAGNSGDRIACGVIKAS